MANNGFVVIDRGIDNSPIWNCDEPFGKRSAWIDLILQANHKETSIVVGNNELTIRRGQKFTSVRKLSAKWGWSPRRTLDFLRLLESMGMIYRTRMYNGTLLTLVNYGKYQDVRNTKVHTNSNTNDSTTIPTTVNTNDPQTTMNNNDINNDINNEKRKPSAFEDF